MSVSGATRLGRSGLPPPIHPFFEIEQITLKKCVLPYNTTNIPWVGVHNYMLSFGPPRLCAASDFHSPLSLASPARFARFRSLSLARSLRTLTSHARFACSLASHARFIRSHARALARLLVRSLARSLARSRAAARQH